MLDRRLIRCASCGALALALLGCELVAGIGDRSATTPAGAGSTGGTSGGGGAAGSAGGTGGESQGGCSFAPLLFGWPDSATPLCSDGSGVVECASAPAGQDGTNVVPPQYDEPGGEVVIDALTGLEWQQNYYGLADHANADACASDTKAGGCWRLPTRLELVSVADFGRLAPAIDDTWFWVSGDEDDVHWTSTAYAANDTRRWAVDFWQGGVNVRAVSVESRYRCVRGALPSEGLSSTGVVATDPRTRLQWLVAAEAPAAWLAALDFCNAATEDGGGWQLPTLKQLLTIVDDTTSQPAADGVLQFAGPPYAHWSSTPAAADAALAWVVDFADGLTDTVDMDELRAFRCARAN